MFYQNLNGTPGSDKTGNQGGDGGVTLNNIPLGYWSGTQFDSLDAWAFLFFSGGQAVDQKDFLIPAWAVRPGDSVAAVSEPGLVVLLGVSSLGMGWAC